MYAVPLVFGCKISSCYWSNLIKWIWMAHRDVTISNRIEERESTVNEGQFRSFTVSLALTQFNRTDSQISDDLTLERTYHIHIWMNEYMNMPRWCRIANGRAWLGLTWHVAHDLTSINSTVEQCSNCEENLVIYRHIKTVFRRSTFCSTRHPPPFAPSLTLTLSSFLLCDFCFCFYLFAHIYCVSIDHTHIAKSHYYNYYLIYGSQGFIKPQQKQQAKGKKQTN